MPLRDVIKFKAINPRRNLRGLQKKRKIIGKKLRGKYTIIRQKTQNYSRRIG